MAIPQQAADEIKQEQTRHEQALEHLLEDVQNETVKAAIVAAKESG